MHSYIFNMVHIKYGPIYKNANSNDCLNGVCECVLVEEFPAHRQSLTCSDTKKYDERNRGWIQKTLPCWVWKMCTETQGTW